VTQTPGTCRKLPENLTRTRTDGSRISDSGMMPGREASLNYSRARMEVTGTVHPSPTLAAAAALYSPCLWPPLSGCPGQARCHRTPGLDRPGKLPLSRRRRCPAGPGPAWLGSPGLSPSRLSLTVTVTVRVHQTSHSARLRHGAT
jgi:hypothetical protein